MVVADAACSLTSSAATGPCHTRHGCCQKERKHGTAPPIGRPSKRTSRRQGATSFEHRSIFMSFKLQIPDSTASIAATSALACAATLPTGNRNSFAGSGAA